MLSTNLKELIQLFFPYSNFRPYQLELIGIVYNIMKNGRIGLISAPCGIGKSVSVLVAYMLTRRMEKSSLMALTRTKNQIDIYSRELRAIWEKSGEDIVLAIFKSRRDMCAFVKERPELGKIRYKDFLAFCRHLRREKACPYYTEIGSAWRPSYKAYRLCVELRRSGPIDVDSFYERCVAEGLCPYEMMKIMAYKADVIVGNYNYLIVEPIREILLKKIGVGIENIHCVIDEAHNLPKYSVDVSSDEMSEISIKRAVKESIKYQCNLENELRNLKFMLDEVTKDIPSDEPKVLSKGEVIALFESCFDAKIETIIRDLQEWGEVIRALKIEEGVRPVSYLGRIGDFLSLISLSDEKSHVYYVVKENDIARIGVKCLDPSSNVSGILNAPKSLIMMSGTLWNFEYYTSILGLDHTRVETYSIPSIYSEKNRLILADLSVTTKFEERSKREFKKIAERLSRYVKCIDGRVAVYFPSYELMKNIVDYMGKLERETIVEDRATRVKDVIKTFLDEENCVLMAVAGGKLSEGIDLTYVGKTLLDGVIIVGLPYPKKDEIYEKQLKYFEEKFGENKAFEYSSIVPCINTLLQAAGRLLRKPDDQGVIIVMDRRIMGRIFRRLPYDWKRDLRGHYKADELIKEIEFFQRFVKHSPSTVRKYTL